MFAELAEPFRAIEAVDRGLDRRPSSRRVVVSTMASFATSWLVPRLARFAVRCPDVEIAIEASSRLVDLKREPVDLAIRHGLGRYSGLDATWLIAPELIVVASPKLLGTGAPIKSPADCREFPLLHDLSRRDWPLWFESHGVDAPQSTRGPAFSDDHLMAQAAAAGQGLALIRDVYAEDYLRSKRLIQILAVRWPTQFAYYVVTTPEALQRTAVRRFRDWLLEEARDLPALGGSVEKRS
jgi:LysR family glycine cleavage system transcriptional activator